jgi:hypothetical protein
MLDDFFCFLHAIGMIALLSEAHSTATQRKIVLPGGESIGWQRWRRYRIAQSRDKVIVFAQTCYGIFHPAEYSILRGIRLKHKLPGIGNRQQVLAKYGFTACG